MTTDITELAQLRAELSNPANGSKDHLRKLALLLVEALEKAQTKAIEQGRSACELFDEVTALRQRIAELESRAVTVENLQESAYRAGLTAGWNLGLANNNDGFNKSLAAHAAGIKVEAE